MYTKINLFIYIKRIIGFHQRSGSNPWKFPSSASFSSSPYSVVKTAAPNPCDFTA